MYKSIRKFHFLFFLLFTLSCSKNNNSNSSNGNIDYEFTITFDGNTSKVKGNTQNDPGYRGPVVNKCIASGGCVEMSIVDQTFHNYITGSPIRCVICNNTGGVYTLGTNLFSVNLYFNSAFGFTFYKDYNASMGTENRLYMNITDLGTPNEGTIGSSNYKFGNPVKGHYSGTVYTKPANSNNATVPHSLTIDFIAVRNY